MRVEITGPANSQIMLVGEAPGEDEDRSGKPFIGYAGHTLDTLLRAAGINRHECLITNVAKERPPGNNFDFFFEDPKKRTPKPILRQFIEELKNDIIKYRPNIVIALGAKANGALTGNWGIERERGYITESTLVPGVKVFSTYHPQAVNHEWKLHFSVIMDLKKALRNSKDKTLPRDNRRLVASAPKKVFLDYLDFLIHDHKKAVVVDIETVQPGTHIEELGLADSPDHAVSFKFLSGRNPKLHPDDELEVWQKLAQVFSVPRPEDTHTIVGHNLAFDNAVLYHHHGIYIPGPCFDTMVATHVCWPETPRSLAFLSSVCLNVPLWKSDNHDPLYNPSDCANTYGCYEVMKSELTKGDHWHVFNYEMAQLEPAIFLHLQGITVDREKQQQLLDDIDSKLHSLKIELSEQLNGTVIFHSSEGAKGAINLNSSQQLQKLLYDDLLLPEQFKRRKKRTDKRVRTVDEEALVKLEKSSDNPVLAKILEGRKLYKLKTFIDIPISPAGKVHTNYNITGANMQDVKQGLVVEDEEQHRSFGRWSSSKSIVVPYGSGNLQNIPVSARKMYVPPPGYEIIEADGVQAEAVVVSYESRDFKLIKLFQDSFGMSPRERKANGYDVHTLNASRMFGIPFAEVDKKQRSAGKTIRHARNYKAGPGVLARRLGCGMKEAKYLLALDEAASPQLALWHTRLEQELKQNGRVISNLFGRKHRFLDRWPKPGQDGSLFRSLASYKPQSTIGDWLNQALVRFYNDPISDTRSLALQLHDAIYVFSPLGEENRRETLKALWRSMKMELTSSHGDHYYIDVDFKIGTSWGDMVEQPDISTKELEQ